MPSGILYDFGLGDGFQAIPDPVLLPVLNPSFEIAGTLRGEAESWLTSEISAGCQIAEFSGDTAFEKFDIDDFFFSFPSFVGIYAEIYLFDDDEPFYERFQKNWLPYVYHNSFLTVNREQLRFGIENESYYEDFSEGWVGEDPFIVTEPPAPDCFTLISSGPPNEIAFCIDQDILIDHDIGSIINMIGGTDPTNDGDYVISEVDSVNTGKMKRHPYDGPYFIDTSSFYGTVRLSRSRYLENYYGYSSSTVQGQFEIQQNVNDRIYYKVEDQYGQNIEQKYILLEAGIYASVEDLIGTQSKLFYGALEKNFILGENTYTLGDFDQKVCITANKNNSGGDEIRFSICDESLITDHSVVYMFDGVYSANDTLGILNNLKNRGIRFQKEDILYFQQPLDWFESFDDIGFFSEYYLFISGNVETFEILLGGDDWAIIDESEWIY